MNGREKEAIKGTACYSQDGFQNKFGQLDETTGIIVEVLIREKVLEVGGGNRITVGQSVNLFSNTIQRGLHPVNSEEDILKTYFTSPHLL